jgi:hypothetical protein
MPEDGDSAPSGLPELVEDLLVEVEALRADVDRLKSQQGAWATAGKQVPATKRTLPTEGEPIELAVLAKWVESLQVRYAAAGDWLRPCWWRHGFVVEELAALRVAWLAVYDTTEPVDATAGVTWHEEAEKCRERIRQTIGVGQGCSAVSHTPDEPVTEDSRWVEELAALENQSAGDLEAEARPGASE